MLTDETPTATVTPDVDIDVAPTKKRRAWEFAVIAAVLAGGVGLLLHDGENYACTLIGGGSSLTVSAPAETFRQIHRIDVELCQHGTCRSTHVFPVVEDAEAELEVDQMREDEKLLNGVEPDRLSNVYIDEDGDSSMGLSLEGRSELAADWTSSPGTTVRVVATDVDGAVVTSHREVFAFDLNQPNGPDCDADANWVWHSVAL